MPRPRECPAGSPTASDRGEMMVYLMWQDDAPRDRGGHRRPLTDRLAPALARFRAKFGRPATEARRFRNRESRAGHQPPP